MRDRFPNPGAHTRATMGGTRTRHAASRKTLLAQSIVPLIFSGIVLRYRVYNGQVGPRTCQL